MLFMQVLNLFFITIGLLHCTFNSTIHFTHLIDMTCTG